MKNIVLSAALLAGAALACLPARAEVLIDYKLSGTGDNVVFESFNGSVAVATFNGQHTGYVDFTDLSGNSLFTGASNGNDIKIENTNNLFIQVFDDNNNLMGTTTDVFSLKGTGDVTAFVTAQEPDGSSKLFQFDLGTLSPTAQSGYTLTAILGEVITGIRLFDVGGNITAFEHYRIDAVPLAAVPLPPALLLFGSGLVGLGFLKRFSAGNKKRESFNASA
jgi:hypothetical protein